MGGKRKRGRPGKGKGKGKGGKGGKGKEDPEEESEDEAEPSEAKKSKREDGWRDTEPWEYKNDKFEAYYRRQAICSEEDFTRLLETLRTGLPAAIRVNRLRLGNASLCQRLAELAESCRSDPERAVYAPEKLPWYEHGLGWVWPGLERRTIKKDSRHASLKEYLSQRERAGLISRQEVVSMLPPLFLGVEPHHLVLDLCAAPGSKTSQMLEVMHWPQVESAAARPTGLVLANELQWRRANMLAHQVGRLGSPCMVVVNCDAQFFPEMLSRPTESGAREALRFDRVLCDVPCSGDGTLRKTPYIWKSWTVRDGMCLHIRQLAILNRGLELLRVGGRLVYSTCSLNPIEDEAVVAALLHRHGDAVELVPPPGNLGEQVKSSGGLASWVVPNPEEEDSFYQDFLSVPAEARSGKVKIHASMFPPFGDFAKRWDAVRGNCRRLLPHLMDTGGFFVAAFEKRAELAPSAKARKEARSAQLKAEKAEKAAAEAAEAAEAPAGEAEPVEVAAESAPSAPGKNQALRRVTKEYIPVETSLSEGEWQSILDFYGLEASLSDRFVVRTEGDKSIFLISEGARRLLQQEVKLPTRMVMCGVLAFQRTGAHHERALPWRLAQEGLAQLSTLGLKRRLACRRSLLLRLLAEKELTAAEAREAEGRGELQGLQALSDEHGLKPGSVSLTLLPDVEEESAELPPYAVAASLSESALELALSQADLASLAEDLNGQPAVHAILSTAASKEEELGADEEDGDAED